MTHMAPTLNDGATTRMIRRRIRRGNMPYARKSRAWRRASTSALARAQGDQLGKQGGRGRSHRRPAALVLEAHEIASERVDDQRAGLLADEHAAEVVPRPVGVPAEVDVG